MASPRITSSIGALRASLGHSQPFKLNYVEIGNEVDPLFSRLSVILRTTGFQDFAASDSYKYRWTSFVNALKSAFPQLRALLFE